MHPIFDFLWFSVFAIYCYIEALVKFFIPVKRKSVAGEIVLITGAASGIGKLTAFEFAKRGSRLVLWDINKPGIQETAEECRKLGVEAYPYVVDCSLRDEIYTAAEKVKKDVGDVTILINNAGMVVTGDLLSTPDTQIQKMYEINILAHYWTIKAFLPAMMKKNHGHIVTVASAGALVPVPFLLPYCSSKSAALGLHKDFTKELSALGKDGIKTTCLCPFFVNTGFVKNPQSRIIPILRPEAVARRLMDGILCNQNKIVMPFSVTMCPWMEIILPERALMALEKILDISFDVKKQE
ncbi:estradiol 17-beta-dehydrogenase 11 [Protobothrops mucrosquamatus]|uniref:estradiol 17-beta-dehydrogenase 11 n=1 Tax=Protobothrops mucrosquamatus TaxID=103944 RepID=UPI0007758AEC|nr:estradiol 17-beta-dehydrogenase 11 [Protobothrops mucrosquamatus]